MNDNTFSWNSLSLPEQPHRKHATNINYLILFDTIYVICFNLWFSLWFTYLMFH